MWFPYYLATRNHRDLEARDIGRFLGGKLFILVEIVGFSDDGLHGVYLVGEKLVPTLVLASGYVYVALA